MSTAIEKHLKKCILPDLERGRANYDKAHTVAVVYWLKEILNHHTYNGNSLVLLIAAYAHDWGYADLFIKSNGVVQLNDVLAAKKQHMIVGAEKLQALLQGDVFSALSDEEKKRCVHLVSVHDDLDNLTDADELLLMEADTLGMLDVERVKPTFDIDSNTRFLNKVQTKRIPKFMTDFGKKMVAKLVYDRQEYYKLHY